ncbi:MAG TPA: zinc ABC transporter substrate-binding protein [Luteolibacter sp.]|nr:zinc ABC transporter substrate-binding protein [Luteolibacter sp.]
MLRKLFLLGALFGVMGCGSDRAADDGRPLVVATTTMVRDLAEQLGGDAVRVVGLMGPGVDPHNYVPRLSDTRLLEQADLVLYSGLHLEGRFQSTLEAMAKRGRHVVAVSAGVPDERLLAPQEDFEGTKDPHFWGDPQLWSLAVEPVVGALRKIAPNDSEAIADRGDAYRAELAELDRWAREKLAQVPDERRVLVTSHDAFFYFGRAYDFEVRGLQGVSTAAEAGLRDRSGLVEFLRAQGVPTVFTETTLNAKGIAAVAREAGVKLSPESLYSDALGEPGDVATVDGESYDRGTYTGMLKHNVNAIVEGLK